MATSVLTEVSIKQLDHDLSLEFQNNRILVDLCGEYDRNLAEIETKLFVQILRRGNQITVIGEREAREQAADLLRILYQRIEQGHQLESDDIERMLRMGDVTVAFDCQNGNSFDTLNDNTVVVHTRKKLVEPRNQAQNNYLQQLLRHELVFGIGPAGTGKTYLAVAVGVSMFLAERVDRIILSRPAVEAGEKLGYLPGDMKDKVDPYMQPLYDALNDFLPSNQVNKLIEEKRIEIAPLAFMRGRTLSNAFVVLDEAQNATVMQMKMFLTRLGQGSRMIITGDQTQVDLPKGILSGLAHAECLLQGIKKIGFSYFTAKHVIRHSLVARIIEAYDSEIQR
ncbi:MAG: PhoH family protein [Aestuariivita sp.]|nr:PhoH family protein [Aestuariivita sp.]